MASHQEFLRYAELCSRMAEDSASLADRDELRGMARAWRKLAAEEERIADLVRAVDQLFPPQLTSAKPIKRRRRLRGLIPRLAESLLLRSSHIY